MKTIFGALAVGLVLSSSAGCDGGDGSGGAGAGGASAGSTGSGGTSAGGSGGTNTGSGGTSAGGSGGTSSGGNGGIGGGSGGSSTGGGGTGGWSPTSGVQGSKRLDALTTQEEAVICDWTVAHFGGYGQTLNCGGGNMITTDPNQAACVAGAYTDCSMTVSEFEICVNEQSCSNLLPNSCRPLLQCV